MQGAAGTSVIAGQVGVITSFSCSNVHCVSLSALHEIPDNEDGGVVALREGCDTREGAGGCGKRQISVLHTAACVIFMFYSGLEYFFLSQRQKCVTCLQVDGGTGLTVTLAVFSNNAEVIEYTACQVFHLTGSVCGGGTVGCVVPSTYS